MQSQRWTYAGVTAITVMLWAQLGISHPLLSLRQVLGDSICLACFARPMVALVHWPSREYAVLPLSARENWRARWLVAVVAPASAVMRGAVLAVLAVQFAHRGGVGVEQVGLCGVLSVTVCGVIFGTVPLVVH